MGACRAGSLCDALCSGNNSDMGACRAGPLELLCWWLDGSRAPGQCCTTQTPQACLWSMMQRPSAAAAKGRRPPCR